MVHCRAGGTHLPLGAKFPNEHIQTHMSESLACTEIAPFNVVMRIRNRQSSAIITEKYFGSVGLW